MSKTKEYLIYLVKGILMGTADVIPGVSGGTIAFITGIYKKLIGSLKEVDLLAVKYLVTFKWKTLEAKINGFFLLTLIIGVFISVFSFAKLIKFILDSYPEAIWAFFFGLIIASTIVIARHLEKTWTVKNIIAFTIGGIVAYLLSRSQIIQTPDTPVYIFFAGVLSIMAMILPGISGSYILVIINKYRFIIDTVAGIGTGVNNIIGGLLSGDMNLVAQSWEESQFMPLLIFEAGTLVGVIGFSKVLNWLFKKFHDITISVLTGFMVGSLNKVWPWKVTLEFYKDRKGHTCPLVEENVLPEAYDQYFFLAVGLAIAGFLIVYLLERFSNKKKESI